MVLGSNSTTVASYLFRISTVCFVKLGESMNSTMVLAVDGECSRSDATNTTSCAGLMPLAMPIARCLRSPLRWGWGTKAKAGLAAGEVAGMAAGAATAGGAPCCMSLFSPFNLSSASFAKSFARDAMSSTRLDASSWGVPRRRALA